MIKNTAQVDTHNEPVKPSLKVHSHWNNKDFVVLQIGPDPEKDRVVVSGEELKRAIDNCMNVGY